MRFPILGAFVHLVGSPLNALLPFRFPESPVVLPDFQSLLAFDHSPQFLIITGKNHSNGAAESPGHDGGLR